MKSFTFRIGWPLSAGLGLALLCLAGCASYDSDLRSRHAVGGAEVEPSFSDEVSRDLLLETRRLLALRDRDYLVGPDDVLELSIFEWELTEETRTLNCRVAESGVISLPVLGAVRAGGKTILEIQQTIERELSARGVLQNPRVAVSITEYRSRRIAVIGAVNIPGVYALHENVTTLMDVLTLAGGPSSDAGELCYVLRKAGPGSEPSRMAVDLEELFDRGEFDLNAVLRGGDIVYVPRAPLIYVYGAVRQPGGFALHRSMRVIEALALAGGFGSRANRSNCYLVRRGRSGPDIVPLNIVQIERGKAPNLYLREGDVVHVPESLQKNIVITLWRILTDVFTFTYRLDSSGDSSTSSTVSSP